MKLFEVISNKYEEALAVIKRGISFDGNTCPRCGKNTMIKTPETHINQVLILRVFGIKLTIPITLKGHVEYCPNCGYLAIKGE